MKIQGIADVGAPDPELECSPVMDSEVEEGEFAGVDAGANVCYFNGIRYPSGEYIRSGDELLRCEDGVWVRAGALYR